MPVAGRAARLAACAPAAQDACPPTSCPCHRHHSAQIAQQLLSPVLHLRTVNPYLAAAMSSGGRGEAEGGVAAPRQPAPWAAVAGGQAALLGGVSGFAFMVSALCWAWATPD